MSTWSAGLPSAGEFAVPPVAVTEAVIAVALYASPLSPAAWRRMGSAGVAAHTARMLAAPGSRLPRLVGAVLAAERDGTLTDPARLTAARRAASRAVAGPARHVAVPARCTDKARHARSKRKGDKRRDTR